MINKLLSKIEDKEFIEVKFIYDKFLLISKEGWNQIIDLANQTKIFTIPELSNIVAVRNSLNKKENMKEQALIKAYESLQKLKKFGKLI